MYIFDSQSEFFRFPQGGIKTNCEITFKIYVKRNLHCSPKILIEKRHDYDKILYKSINMEWIGAKKNYDLYKGVISIKEYGHYYYSFIFDENNCSKLYELLIYDVDYSTPHWIKGGIIYHIFVDRFYKKKTLHKDGDIEIRNDWGGIPHYLPDENGKIINNDFFGGNLDGITEKLPYLSSLGVTAIYLSPIFEAYSNHKYDTGDYSSVDPMFGSENILSGLCSEAESLGISVILDGVFNHTGTDSIYFNKDGHYNSTGAFQSKESPYYDWYMFNKWNDDYVCWWNIKTLPAINKSSKSYINFIAGENGVLKHWQKIGVKGWRLDVADELPNEFLNNLRSAIKGIDKEAYIVGEVWEDASNKFAYSKLKEYFCGKQLDSVTNYPLRDAIINYVKNKDCSELYETMNMIIEKYPPQTVNCLMNVLGTHDTARILTLLGSSEVPLDKSEMACMNLTEGTKLLKIAVLLQMTLPGVPCIYYGDEAGVEGWSDPFNRTCYPWGNENQEIMNHYKYLAEFRKYNSIFSEGKYKCLVHDKGVFVFERYNEKNKIIVALNMNPNAITLCLNKSMKEYGTSYANNKYDLKSNEYMILCSV
ncbi:MAG: glycoside hydrolase family 13 protein [Sedimentibacter sp.]|uniref:glycoside hydrolase family 13 protein n=1 Tax=Sedimentibacter sp. TaxID=1960295 RepID=UPI002982AE57|nr:glycoside hydrolase family 13 protein [Sedimentibacter sp.]MDW5299031.1 glycoside hydrolase family 13 protein [Sedimentibacter sp.]